MVIIVKCRTLLFVKKKHRVNRASKASKASRRDGKSIRFATEETKQQKKKPVSCRGLERQVRDDDMSIVGRDSCREWWCPKNRSQDMAPASGHNQGDKASNPRVSKKGQQRKKGPLWRPASTKACNDVDSCIKYRGFVLTELSSYLGKINDPLLTEYQLRDVNDKINELLRERRYWELRIKELGGPDFRKQADPEQAFTFKGYKYFGRARELPDVVKLLEEVTIARSNAKNADNEKKRLQMFNDKKNWIGYSLDVEAPGPMFKDEGDSLEVISFRPSDKPPVTEDKEFMKDFLLKEKKKYLLQRIRAKK